MSSENTNVPPVDAPGRWRADLVSGLLVFLIALPLCLGIAKASGYPPIAGIWTAVIGGMLTCFLSNSQLTIKGPAAGMIVIVLGAVDGFDAPYLEARTQSLVAEGKSPEEAKKLAAAMPKPEAYRLALGVGVVAGILQVLFGLFRGGILAEVCPMTPIHALLASIGIIIMFKQGYPMLGMTAPGGEAIHSVLEFPGRLLSSGPNGPIASVAAVGLLSLALLILLTQVKIPYLKALPPQIIVVAAAVPLAMAFGLTGNTLVPLPDVLSNPEAAFAKPDFTGLLTSIGIQYIVLFALIGTLESLLSAKAIDLLDPWKRKTDLNRDVLAVGAANTASSAIGGLPMISEIVRSKANIDNGARTRFANFFHACFLLGAALAAAPLIRMIPIAALGALLVFTGFRLAHPREFIKTYKIGPEQLVVFLTTIIVILSTDLLIGFFAGVAMELFFHLLNGASFGKLFGSAGELIEGDADTVVLQLDGAAAFTNWLKVRKHLDRVGTQKHVIVDFSRTRLVDHTVMEKLHELEHEYAEHGRRLELRGLDEHRSFSKHPLAARKKRLKRLLSEAVMVVETVETVDTPATPATQG